MDEKQVWSEVNTMFDQAPFIFGANSSAEFRNDPKRIVFELSKYKFAAKIGVDAESILELGCGDGVATSILAENARSYLGIGSSTLDISHAKKTYEQNECVQFEVNDFHNTKYGTFDLVVSLDSYDSTASMQLEKLVATMTDNLREHGIGIVGIWNKNGEFPGTGSLEKILEAHFEKILFFGMNEEVVHTDINPSTSYIFAIGLSPIQGA